MMALNKAGNVPKIAPLILLIGVTIIFYILFLPPDIREEILGIDNINDSYEGGSLIPGRDNVILRTNPGRLEKLDVREVRNALPAAVLFADFKDTEIAVIRSIYTENGLFNEETDRLPFSIANSNDVRNVLLSFTAREMEGRLIIKLNDAVIYNSEISSPTIAPILLPNNLLKNDNVIEFRVASSGIKFWKKNKVVLENVKVTGEVRDIRNLEAETSFIVLNDDLRNTETVTLRFVPNCDPYDVGRLDVAVNDRIINSGVPVCGDVVVKEFTAQNVFAGDNKIKFKTDRGSYVIDSIEIIQHMKAPSYKTFYFEMEEHQIIPVLERNDLATNLFINFADDRFRNLDVFVNGRVYHIDDNKDFVANIEQFLFTGTNAIKLIPKSKDIDVIEMVVKIEQLGSG